MTDDAPTTEERAKFYLNNSISLVGHEDTLATLTGDDPQADGVARNAEQAIRNLAITFDEGVRRNMQNSREHGSHPVNAFKKAIKSDWPDWVKVSLAEQEYNIFSGGFPEDRTEKAKEYLDFLEEEYGVPQ